MNPILKGTIAFGTVAGAGGTAYGIYNAMQPAPEKVKSYAEELEGTLLTTTNDTHKSNWESRLKTLQSLGDDIEVVQGLKVLKKKETGNDQWKKLRGWCENVVKASSKGERDIEFQNIQSYCTFSIKEKITDFVDDGSDGGDSKWDVALNKLKAINDQELTSDLIAAKANNTKFKEWCTATYKKPYKGVGDREYKYASKICKKS